MIDTIISQIFLFLGWSDEIAPGWQALLVTGLGLAAALLVWGFLALLQRGSLRRLKGHGSGLLLVLKTLGPPLIFLFFISQAADLFFAPRGRPLALGILLTALTAWVVVRGASDIFDWLIVRVTRLRSRASAAVPSETDPPASTPEELSPRLKSLLSMVHLFFWLLGILFVLDNLGFNISAVVAGLGISGIAVAIAAQGILGDLFNYFVIHFDRPFEMGDFVIFGDKMGTVERIGVKTTRIRAIGGEQLIVANTDLTSTRVHNYKRMERRRAVFHFGVTHDTAGRKLQAIPGMVKQIIEADERALFDRCHFSEFGPWSLVFETVYYVLTPDYAVYRDVQQQINLRIKDFLEKNKIALASPSQRVSLEDNRR